MNETCKLVQAAEHQRCLAMINNDSDALDALLDVDLIFSHATGAIDSKNAYLAKLKAGRIVYRRISWSEQNCITLTDGVVLSGRMTSLVEVEGKPKELDNRVLAVWRLAGSWRLLAFQSTPLISAAPLVGAAAPAS
jgi:Domain of unknown function (DUF4440)